MFDHPIFQAISGVMVLLLVLAWWFPDQRWLDPFRARRLPSAPSTRAARAESRAAFPMGRAAAARGEATTLDVLAAKRHRGFRRISRIYAGVSIMAIGVAILFGHYLMARMTGTDPEAGGVQVFPMVLAAVFVVAGAVVMLVPERHR